MRRAILGSLAAPVLAVAVAAAGCNRSQPQPSTNTAAQSPAAEPTTPADRLGDSALATAVQAKFYVDDRIRGHDIDVSAESGTIVLRGTVPNDAVKAHAVSLARSVDRVTNVNDQIQVQEPPVRSANAPGQQDGRATRTTGRAADALQPWWITTKIQAQYFADADVKPWNVDVTTVSNGVVTLEGTVDSTEAKNEAVRIARETEGVTRVEDRLRVEANARRAGGGPNAAEPAGIAPPDAWLTAKVQAKYFIDDDVKGRNIDVQTQNGVVTLTGGVASEAERRQAVAIARNTDGVRNVSDKLRVDAVDTTMTRPAGAPAGQPAASGQAGPTAPGASSAVQDRRRTAAGPKPGVRIERPDAWITMKIQAKYFLDAEVKGHAIDVDTSNGIVTLTGRVENAEQRADAEQIARETEGVTRVNNQLTVGASPAS
jgi:osmotically-inducible protein OsmY